LNYPSDKYEIIFVDDHSDDSTAKIIGSYCDRNSNWRIISLKEKSISLKGKKNALQQGIGQAKGEIIFTTDADCIVPPDWLSNLSGYFQTGISMVLGYSPLIKSKKLYYRLLQFDNLFSGIAAAATAKLGYPFTSVGRNLAYRKDTYEDVGGFLSLKKFKSGDDIHLTGKFRHNNNGRIDYCADPTTFVHTLIPSTFREVIQQQIRKNSKTFQLSGLSVIAMLMIFLYYILLFIMPYIMPTWVNMWLFIVIVKLLTEYMSLYKAAKIFQQTDLIPYILPMQIIYPFYIIIFSVIGTFQYYHWKK
jgi:cellulose synthase/poly-beta-1,6-N-acetylglucosamine synthase-like glycosyltransferase